MSTTNINISLNFEQILNIISQLPNIEKVKLKQYLIKETNTELPQWQKDILDERLESFKNNPEDVYDFEETMNDIEKSL